MIGCKKKNIQVKIEFRHDDKNLIPAPQIP